MDTIEKLKEQVKELKRQKKNLKNKIRYYENYEKEKQRSKDKYLKNIDSEREKRRIYAKSANGKKSNQMYRENNREKEKKRHKIYYDNNLDKERIRSKKYRESESGSKIEKIKGWKQRGLIDNYDKVYQRYEYTLFCDECRCDLDQCEKSVKSMDHDHITGLFRNILCRSCNIKRG